MANDLVLPFDIWLIVKIFYLLALGLFVLFAVIVRKQIQLMTNTLNGTMDSPIKNLGLVFLIMTIVIFFLGLILL